MKKITILSIVPLLMMNGLAFANYDLVCKNEYSGQREVVHVQDVDNFSDACSTVKNDPNYSDYAYPTCQDAEGDNGACPKDN